MGDIEIVDGVQCECCDKSVPAKDAHLCEEDGTWLCKACVEDTCPQRGGRDG